MQAWEQVEPNGGVDAFSKYSNDATRMRYLLFKDNEDEEIVAYKDINCNNDSKPQDGASSRKTRISFELHPTLILEDLLPSDQVNAQNEGSLNDDDSDDDLGILLSLLKLQAESKQ